MPFRIKVSLAIIGLLALLVLVGPFLMPVPPLEGTVPPHQLAGEENRFTEVRGVELHYLDSGIGSGEGTRDLETEPSPQGDAAAGGEGAGDTVFLLLHGYPSNAASWRSVMPELALYGRAVAFDQPGLGLSARPQPGSWSRGENPYLRSEVVEQAVALLDEIGAREAVWIGSSSGAVIALEAALSHPERVAALVLESAPVYSTRAPPGWLRPLLDSPQLNRIGPLLLRQLGDEPGLRLYRSQWARPEQIDEEDVAAFRITFAVDDWDEGLWEVSKASRPFTREDELGELGIPTLILAGAADPIVAPEESQRLAAELPRGTLALMEGCGHVPHRECPAQFVQVLGEWLQGIEGSAE